MNRLKCVRKCLNPVYIKNYFREYLRLRRIPLSQNSIDEVQKKYEFACHWHWTLSLWYILILVTLIEILWGPIDVSILILIIDIVALGMVSIAMSENTQYKDTLQLFIYMKQQEDVSRRMLELLIENNGGKK